MHVFSFWRHEHRRLLNKLKSYKLHSSIIDCIKNFITDRKQRVWVDGAFSCWAKVLSGIPQGSILDPLLFIIFINNLVDICGENIALYLFADDAKMYCHVKDLADKDKLQRRIEKFVIWTNKWQVSLNIKKCKIMSVHHRRYSNMGVSPNYVMNNTPLEEVMKIKDLDVCFDSLLLFDKHISEKNKQSLYDVGHN